MALRGSDVDCTVVHAWGPEDDLDARRDAMKLWLRQAAARLPAGCVEAAHLGAKVPSLRLNVLGRRADLTYGNAAGIAKTRLAAGVLAGDPALRGACVLLRASRFLNPQSLLRLESGRHSEFCVF